MTDVLLLLTLAIPLAAAVLLLMFRRSMSGHTPRWIALAATVATLLVSIGLAQQFRELPPANPAGATAEQGDSPIQPRFEQRFHWLTLRRERRRSRERERRSSTFTSGSTASA